MEYDINRIESVMTQKTKYIMQASKHIFQICIDCIVHNQIFFKVILFCYVLHSYNTMDFHEFPSCKWIICKIITGHTCRAFTRKIIDTTIIFIWEIQPLLWSTLECSEELFVSVQGLAIFCLYFWLIVSYQLVQLFFENILKNL